MLTGKSWGLPVLDSRVYEVWFPDRRPEELAANVNAEAIYAQCDADGNQYVLLDSIVDYRGSIRGCRPGRSGDDRRSQENCQALYPQLGAVL